MLQAFFLCGISILETIQVFAGLDKTVLVILGTF